MRINEVVNAIRSYTNRAFISSYIKGEIDTRTITGVKGVYEIRGSRFNDGFYFYEDSFLGLVDEVYDGYLIRLQLPVSYEQLNAMSDSISQLSKKGNVRREQIGDTSYTLSTGSSVGGVPLDLLASLNYYRVLPGGIEKEYIVNGIV